MLSDEQLRDLEQLQAIAGVELVIVGAAALRCFLEMEGYTEDIDLVAALDLEDFADLTIRLKAHEWRQERRQEHRWIGPAGAMFDLLPAGPRLRRARKILWPDSQFEMSLVGFDHVFAYAVPYSFAPGLSLKVAPVHVVAFLKIVAFMENPVRREKDLRHVKWLLRHYEEDSVRCFSDEIFTADLQDIELASAFLLGLDVGSIAAEGDAQVVAGFLARMRISSQDFDDIDREDPEQGETLRFQLQLRAFEKGFQAL